MKTRCYKIINFNKDMTNIENTTFIIKFIINYVKELDLVNSRFYLQLA